MAYDTIRSLRRTIAGVRVSNLFDPGGKPLGWAHHAERDLIRAHLKRRGRWIDKGYNEFEVTRIQQRMHKYDKSFRELQALYRIAKPIRISDDTFNRDELERLIEHFDGANDPVGQAIAEKVKLRLDKIVSGEYAG